MMKRLLHLTMGGVLIVTAVAGCGVPEPPQKVSAYLPKNVPVVGVPPEVCEKADTLVLARCMQTKEYATTVQGDWVSSWYLTIWRVIRVERGKWPLQTVSFVFVDKWPSPESGITVNKTPTPYHVGAIRAFCINTGGKPTIAADQSRSRIPPYGSVTRPTYDASDPNVPAAYERIGNAAKTFVWKERGATGAVDITEQYGRLYVAEIRTESSSIAVVVDGDSLTVQWADPADALK